MEASWSILYTSDRVGGKLHRYMYMFVVIIIWKGTCSVLMGIFIFLHLYFIILQARTYYSEGQLEQAFILYNKFAT